MNLKPILWIAGTMLCIAATSASAQVVVYKCGPRSYSQHPCSKRIVNTDDAPVHRKPNPKEVDVHRIEQNRALARSTRRLPGETSAEFQVRRHRARLLQTDREECERLDSRIPLEQARMKSPDRQEILNAGGALSASKKRFAELRC
ncbi:MAG: hypothetical protein K0Q43_2382 [Ramlibacter sp.]|jgi:hypothetical protein|nr:hypothetical protein [Ramlibacter sp.]